MVLDNLRELSFSLMNNTVEYHKKILLDLCKIVFLLITSSINDLRFEKCKFILRKLDKLDFELKKKLTFISGPVIQAKSFTEIEFEESNYNSSSKSISTYTTIPLSDADYESKNVNREFYK